MIYLKIKYQSAIRIFSIIILIFALANCSNTSINNDNDIGEISLEDTVLNIKKTDDIYKISTPNEIIKIFGKKLLKYKDNIVNNPDKHSTYLDSKSQALNIGIYMTDAAYLNLFNHTNEAYQFIEAIYYLSDKVKISQTLDEELFNRLKNNALNKDSLEHLSEDIFFNLFNQLVGSPRENMAALITIGCYIEILYISIESVDEYNPDNILFSHIEDFYIMLEHVYLFVEHNTIDLNVEIAFNYICRIKSILDESEKKVKKNSQGYEIETNREISKEQFYRLKNEINSIRKEIIGE